MAGIASESNRLITVNLCIDPVRCRPPSPLSPQLAFGDLLLHAILAFHKSGVADIILHFQSERFHSLKIRNHEQQEAQPPAALIETQNSAAFQVRVLWETF